MEEFAKYSPLITIAVGIFTIAGILIGVGRWVQKLDARFNQVDARFDKIDARMNAIEQKLNALNSWAAGFSIEVNSFFGVMVQLLNNRRQLTSEELNILTELSMVTERLPGLAEPAPQTLFEKERLSRNPVTSDELNRLEGY